MLILFIIFTITFARLLQRGPHPPRDDGNRRQPNNTINQLFEHLAKDLDQDQKEELKMIQSYVFDEGFQYYQKQNKDNKDKIWSAFLGMAEELDKQTGQENQRIEKDIEYFSSLNYTDKDIILTQISQNLERNLNDTTKQFNSKLVLNTIEQSIENFKSNPDRSIQTTWNTKEYINQQYEEQEELEEIEYQIQEFLDQGLSDEDVKKNITLFINQYFNESQNLQGDLNNIDQIIKEISQQEKQKNSTQKYKNIRQEIRQIIRESLKEGKTEQEITQIIQEFLNKNGYNNLSEKEKEEIQQIIKNEIIRFKRQQEYQKNISKNDSSLTTDEDNHNVDNNQNDKSEEYHIKFYVIGFSVILMVLIILFVIRRYRIKSKQIRFKIQESSQEVEQMD
ncbi:unnamed protein product [Paramecium pentaurelia]|uniref:Transmembrane protein n=1 Tax=Paramecium pentaurelia TaxID=43138 RepID=A0A8S1SMG7_9CILI|nr:unnamed protein product [Paramecium pentaurelia]